MLSRMPAIGPQHARQRRPPFVGQGLNPIPPIIAPPDVVVPLATGLAKGAEAAAEYGQEVVTQAENAVQSVKQAASTWGGLGKGALILGALWLLNPDNRQKAGGGIEWALAAAALLL